MKTPTVPTPFREGSFSAKSDPSTPTFEETLARMEIESLRNAFDCLTEVLTSLAAYASEVGPGEVFSPEELQRLTTPPRRLL